jgi:predicted CXXCH cytochrome family protein
MTSKLTTRPRGWIALGAAIAVATGAAWFGLRPAADGSAPAASTAPHDVGSEACARCHAAQAQAWRDSHHHLAMQDAVPGAVLGDFGAATFAYDGVTSSFATRDGRYFVTTDGPDGSLREYPIRYAFGVHPLQQYLIELDHGRVQALGIAWDARPKERGGQRWYHLYPGEKVDHRDVLHWTRRSQNWNHMCAECHTTGFAKNYDPETRAYRSRFDEMGVGCEACHGPGSGHVAWAEGAQGADAVAGRGLSVHLDERLGITWRRDPQTHHPQRSAPRATTIEIDTCARCHSRRSQLVAEPARGQPLSDTHLPALIEPELYEADGQIRGEVYEYGSFLQSRMFQAGVTCSDCHDPHAARLRAEGDGVCLQCHSQTHFATREHHFHAPDSPGARCVSCHMPSRTYMGVDVRHDHSFRVPRPLQSAALGTPNACTDCHADRTPQWAGARVREWYGHDPTGLQGYAEALHAARSRAVDPEPLLLALLRETTQPAIARATAAAELAPLPSRATLDALARAQGDPSPLVRQAALRGLSALPPDARWRIGAPRLRDSVRAVRIAAVELLADAGAPPPQDRSAWDAATADYLAVHRQNADQSEAHVSLGNFYGARGDFAAAERDYRDAIAIDPAWVPSYVNLADLLRALGRDAEGEAVLAEGIARAPGAAALHHSLGLLKVRAHDLPGALEALRRAAELAPDEPRYAYVYSVALHDAGRAAEAIRVADAALARAPGDRELRDWRARLTDVPSERLAR